MGNNLQLVFLKKDDVFTTSKIIAEGVGISHEELKRIIIKNKKQLEQLGKLQEERG